MTAPNLAIIPAAIIGFYLIWGVVRYPKQLWQSFTFEMGFGFGLAVWGYALAGLALAIWFYNYPFIQLQ